MSTSTLVTAEELMAMPTGLGNRYELVAGEVRIMSPSGWAHGKVVGKLHVRLGYYIEQQNLGTIFGAETGFRLASNPDTVRAPDIAFIANDKLPSEQPQEVFWPGAPDLVVEVLSPNDRLAEVDQKISEWLVAGSGEVWVVDPKLETITIYRSRIDVEVRTANDMLIGDPVVPGFSCPVAELFR